MHWINKIIGIYEFLKMIEQSIKMPLITINSCLSEWLHHLYANIKSIWLIVAFLYDFQLVNFSLIQITFIDFVHWLIRTNFFSDNQAYLNWVNYHIKDSIKAKKFLSLNSFFFCFFYSLDYLRKRYMA